MNVPNLITMSRFLLIPVFIVVFANEYVKTAFFIVLLAGATDVLDGYIARRSGQITEIGIMLDPLADKTMMLTVFISLLYTAMIPWQAAVAMFVREIGMIAWSAIAYFQDKKPVPANVMGKLTTVLYYLAVLFIVYDFKYNVSFLWYVIVFSFITSIVYVFQYKLINPRAKAS